ncbi:hypothetical protein [Hoeflea sp.]|uniref:hypothetical protein n=1 Tax=Hoeflea sp. TaxID=1940281 RepID=UPI003A95DB50
MTVSHPDPRELTLPLRDLVRGLRQKTSTPRAMLAPALELLPGPLRDVIKNIAHIGRETEHGTRATRQPQMAVITRSAAALRGEAVAASDTAAAASYAIGILLDAVKARDLLVSETMLALCWHDAREQSFRAAGYLYALFDREPFGVAPGLLHSDPTLSDTERLTICIAVVLWLLSDHDDEGISEFELVKIAGWLAVDCLETCQAKWDDREQLQTMLIDTAGRI